MIVTEEQARALWCPQALVAFPGGITNRISTARLRSAEKEADRTGDVRDRDYYREQQADTKCIASACMFWKFVGSRMVANGYDEAHGCCGLAVDYPAEATGWRWVQERLRWEPANLPIGTDVS